MFQKNSRIINKDLLKSYHSKGCLICNRLSDPCHIKSKGSGGDDIESNLMPLCREHHTKQHQIGWRRMTELYPQVYFYLKRYGWSFDENNKLIEP